MTGELSNVYSAFDAVGNKEDLSDIITNIAPEEAPFYDRMGTTKAEATYHEFLTDTLAAATANAQVEGKTFSATAITAPVRYGNYVQLFTKEFTISDIQEVVKKAGRAKESAYQMQNKIKEMKRDCEFALFNMVASAGASGGEGTARQMKTVYGWVAGTSNTGTNSNLVSTSATGTDYTMTEADLNNLLEQVWEDGGKPNAIYCGGKIKKRIAVFATSTSRVWEGSKKVVNALDVYESDFGVLNSILDRHVDGTVASGYSYPLYVIQENLWKKAILQPVAWNQLAKRGLGTDFQLYHSWTLEAKNASGNGLMFSW